MRHKRSHPLIGVFLLACSAAVFAQDEKWITFTSHTITPKPLTWQTEDWEFYTEAKGVPFQRYTFKYPEEWTFTGYSVFTANNERKIAEIAPGVVLLPPNRKCFDNATFESLEDVQHQPFRFGRVRGRVVVANMVTVDTAALLRVYAYCIQEGGYAFRVNFIAQTDEPQKASVFRRVIRSFRFLGPA